MPVSYPVLHLKGVLPEQQRIEKLYKEKSLLGGSDDVAWGYRNTRFDVFEHAQQVYIQIQCPPDQGNEYALEFARQIGLNIGGYQGPVTNYDVYDRHLYLADQS